MTYLRTLLAIACLFVAGVPAAAAAASVTPPSHWKQDIAAFVAQDRADMPPTDGVLFIGSSSIRFWTTLQRDFPGVPVIRRGFGGSTIADSTFYADKIVVPYHPRVIVMYAGDNDIAEGLTSTQVVDEFKAFAARVHRDLPDTAIIYLPIKPSVARASMWPDMQKANAGIRDWAKGHPKIRYVDTASAMLDDAGKPRPELLRDDGLHMNRAGYAIWVDMLRPVLAGYGFTIHQADTGRSSGTSGGMISPE